MLDRPVKPGDDEESYDATMTTATGCLTFE
jgi:hypothetical protein